MLLPELIGILWNNPGPILGVVLNVTILVWLGFIIWFNGISTFIDYLMPNLVYTYIIFKWMVCQVADT